MAAIQQAATIAIEKVNETVEHFRNRESDKLAAM
jgi:hypothetical protein